MSDTHSAVPAVSVITPAYNAAPFIGRTIESALAQTYRDFELLVVDDGSHDETASIVEGFARQDARVHLTRQANAGTSAARNAALARARGGFIALLDSDDVWFPTYLAEQLEILSARSDVDVLSANALNSGGPLDGQPLLAVPDAEGLHHLSLLRMIEAEDAVSILAIMRRTVVDRLGGYDVTMRRSEDYDFWLRAAAAGFGIAVNPKPLGLYCRRPDSLSANELLMLIAMSKPLEKIRDACPDRPDVQRAAEHQLASIARRRLVAAARSALTAGDMPALTAQLATLAEATGETRYRAASWLSQRAPATIRVAYACKRATGRMLRAARFLNVRSAARPKEATSSARQHRTRNVLMHTDNGRVGSSTQ